MARDAVTAGVRTRTKPACSARQPEPARRDEMHKNLSLERFRRPETQKARSLERAFRWWWIRGDSNP